MKDKKISILGTIIFLVGLGMFNLCVFLIVSDYTAVFWTAYIFTTIAFVTQGVMNFIFEKYDLNEKFLGLPLIYIGSVYFIIQLIIGIVCMMVPVSITFSILVQSIILAIYITMILTWIIAKEYIMKTDGNIKKVTNPIRTLTMEAEHLYLSQENGSKKNELKKLYEAIKYSDPMSNTDEICMMDEQINTAFFSLREKIPMITDEDVKQEIKKILVLLTKRNLMCKESK